MNLLYIDKEFQKLKIKDSIISHKYEPKFKIKNYPRHTYFNDLERDFQNEITIFKFSPYIQEKFDDQHKNTQIKKYLQNTNENNFLKFVKSRAISINTIFEENLNQNFILGNGGNNSILNKFMNKKEEKPISFINKVEINNNKLNFKFKKNLINLEEIPNKNKKNQNNNNKFMISPKLKTSSPNFLNKENNKKLNFKSKSNKSVLIPNNKMKIKIANSSNDYDVLDNDEINREIKLNLDYLKSKNVIKGYSTLRKINFDKFN